MRSQTKLRLCVTALVLLAVVGCSSKPEKSPPPSQMQTIEEFTQDKLNEYRGKIVVLNFWAIWCAPCRAELPDLQAVHQEYQDQGVVIVGVNVSESSEDIIAFAQKLGVTFPMLRDSQHSGMNSFGVQVLPTTFFLNQEGQVKRRWVGTANRDLLQAGIEALLP